jgi:hypothetical protein
MYIYIYIYIYINYRRRERLQQPWRRTMMTSGARAVGGEEAASPSAR